MIPTAALAEFEIGPVSTSEQNLNLMVENMLQY